MPFVPIEIDDYVRKHLESNPRDEPREIRSRLEAALEARLAGRTCDCGEPIWVIGSAVAHYACFTCITGEAVLEVDFEIAAACRGRAV